VPCLHLRRSATPPRGAGGAARPGPTIYHCPARLGATAAKQQITARWLTIAVRFRRTRHQERV